VATPQYATLLDEGRIDDLIPSMVGRNGVLVSTTFAPPVQTSSKENRILLDTPSGPQQFEVAGVQVDYMSENGSYTDRPRDLQAVLAG